MSLILRPHGPPSRRPRVQTVQPFRPLARRRSGPPPARRPTLQPVQPYRLDGARGLSTSPMIHDVLVDVSEEDPLLHPPDVVLE